VVRRNEVGNRRGRRGGGGAVVALGLLLGGLGLATPARGGEEEPEGGTTTGAQPEGAEAEEEEFDLNRWEPAAIPAINYSSDIGLGFGAVGTLARFEEGFNPYRARIQLLVFMAAKQDATGTIGIPFHDHAVQLDLPGLWDDLLRINLRLAFGRYTNTGYYGLGNASEARSFSDAELEESEVARRYHTYELTNPNGQLNGRFKLFETPSPEGRRRLEALVGVSAAYSWINRYEGSKLAQDVALAASDTPDGRTLDELLHGTGDHAFLAFNTGLLWDTRDHEYAPNRGTFTELSAQWSPGVDADLRYIQVFLGTRWFAPIVHEVLVVATRVAADGLIGDPPLGKESLFGVLQPSRGPGGAASVRGVAQGRYHGKIKTLLNVEVRGSFPRVEVWGDRLRFGLLGFADAGRVWADWRSRSVAGVALDGPYSPFKVGVGGGGRIQWGETFVLRADFGYSPTDETTGFYIDIGHVF